MYGSYLVKAIVVALASARVYWS